MDINELFNECGFVLLYLAVALVGVLLIAGLVVYFLRREKFGDFKKYAIGISTGLAICALVFMTYLKSRCNEADGTVMHNMQFIPIMVELSIAILGVVAMLICSLINKKSVKYAGIVTGVLLIGGFIAIVVEMCKFYEMFGQEFDADIVGLTVTMLVMMALIAVIYFLGDKRNISDTRSIVYGAVAIALSFALSYVKFFEMPQGGSLTFASLLPLMVYCCMFGTRRGVIACLIYGVLQAVQDPYVIHPLQFLIDYPLAFGMVGVSGIFVEKNVFRLKGKGEKFNAVLGFASGAVVAVIGRYACHVCAGVFAFHTWADLATYSTVTAYSMAYNSFAFADMAISLGAGVMLFMSRAFLAQMSKSADVGRASANVETVELDDGEDDGFVYLDDMNKNDAEETVSDSVETACESSENEAQ